MSKLTGHEVRLASRPEGIPAAFNFTLVRTELEPLQDGEVLVRNLFMSVDPYMRGRMNEGQSYVPPFELGNRWTAAQWVRSSNHAPTNSGWGTLLLPVVAGGNTSSLRHQIPN